MIKEERIIPLRGTKGFRFVKHDFPMDVEGNCSVRALAVAFGVDYQTALRVVTSSSCYIRGGGVSNGKFRQFLATLQLNGQRAVRLDYNFRGRHYPKLRDFLAANAIDSPQTNNFRSAILHIGGGKPGTTYTEDHTTAIVDSALHDIFVPYFDVSVFEAFIVAPITQPVFVRRWKGLVLADDTEAGVERQLAMVKEFYGPTVDKPVSNRKRESQRRELEALVAAK